MDPLISILKNWSFLGGGQVMSSLLGVIFTVAISRALGDVEFGRLYLALTLTSLVGVLCDFGLGQVIIRTVARDRALARSYFQRAAIVVGVFGTGLYLLLLVFVEALGFTSEIFSLVLILGLLMVVDAFSQILGALFLAHERMLVPAVSRVAGNAVGLVLVLPILLAGHATAAVGIVIVVAGCVRLLIQAVAVRRLPGLQLPTHAAPAWPVMLRAGVPFVVAQGLGLFVFKIDVVVLGRMSTEATVGWYAAASRVVDSFNFIPIVLTMATFPVLSRLWVEAPTEFQATARRTLHVLLAVTIPASVILFVLARDIVGFLFTLSSYGPAVPILRIQAMSLALIFIDYLLVCALMAIGRERVWIAIIGAACVLNPVLNWLLIPQAQTAYANGALGAALATLLTEMFILTCALRAIPRGTFTFESLWTAGRVAALGALLGVSLFGERALGVPWILAAAVGSIGYVAAAMRFGVLPPSAIAWARDAFLAGPRKIMQRRVSERATGKKATESAPGVEAA